MKMLEVSAETKLSASPKKTKEKFRLKNILSNMTVNTLNGLTAKLS